MDSWSSLCLYYGSEELKLLNTIVHVLGSAAENVGRHRGKGGEVITEVITLSSHAYNYVYIIIQVYIYSA